MSPSPICRIPVLGLDWDGTLSCYAGPLGVVAAQAERVVIITLNDSITPERAANALGIAEQRVVVEICPNDRVGDYCEWKAERCLDHAVTLMFDDDHYVVEACRRNGVFAICVTEL